jgi:8-oxo-dGTP diphosphatase
VGRAGDRGAVGMKEVCVELAVMTARQRSLEVLVVRRPGNIWSLPAAPADDDRALADTALQTLTDQTGIREIWLEQLFTFDRSEGRAVAIAHLALIAADRHPVTPGRDVVEVRWFPLGDLPQLPSEHRDVVEYAHQRLRAKTAYAPIAVQLLPELFTLSDLQGVYEAVLGTTLDTRNFRRDLLAAGIVAPAGQLRARGPGRPAQLYRSVDGSFAVDARERRIVSRLAHPEGTSTQAPAE